ETYHNFFVKRWSFHTGAILLTLMFVFVINTTGKSWGVTSSYSLWGVWLFEKFGVNFAFNAPLAEVSETVSEGLLNHPGTIRNLGIIIGSTIALLLAGQFKFNLKIKGKDLGLYVLGGLLMGYGARIASG